MHTYGRTGAFRSGLRSAWQERDAACPVSSGGKFSVLQSAPAWGPPCGWWGAGGQRLSGL